MSKARIIDRRSEKSIKGERDFLSILRHSFIVNMNCSFQDYENLYLVMDLLTGGDLRYHLCKMRHFSEEETKFFIACLLLGLEYIHNNNIIHRDIKPENLVSDDNGYIRITDFGVAKIRKEDNSNETSGTPGYMAPEVLMAQNHSFPVDFFAIGIMGYEFMFGQRPYIGKSRKEIKHLILKKQAKIDEDEKPDDWSLESVDFINKCIKRKESRRLGYNNGVSELKNHPWFKDFDWDSLYKKKIPAPFVPKKSGNYDRKYCEAIEKISDNTLERYQTYIKRKNFKFIFQGYTFVNPELLQSNIEMTTNITTNSRSNKPPIKPILSTVNNKKNAILDNNNLQLHANNEVIIEEKNINTNININTYINDKLSKNSSKNLQIDVLQQLNYLSFSKRDEKSSQHSPLNSGFSLNTNNLKTNDLINLKDNSTLSLQKYLNYSRQKRIKFDGINKSTFYQKGEEIPNKEKGNEKESNLSELENSNLLYNNNFKKVLTKYDKKIRNSRSSSVYNSTNNNKNNNNYNNINNYKNNNEKKDRLNKNRAGRTIDVNKINKLYNLMNLNMKGSLSGKNIIEHNKKINFHENFLYLGSPIISPKNLNRGNLKLKKEFIFLKNKNKMIPFYLPNLMKGGNMSPSFIHDKLDGKLHLNLNNQFNLNINQNNINYKKLLNNNNTRKFGFKRSGSTGLFNHFINNDINGGVSSKSNRNKINMGDLGNHFYNEQIKKKYHNESDIKE